LNLDPDVHGKLSSLWGFLGKFQDTSQKKRGDIQFRVRPGIRDYRTQARPQKIDANYTNQPPCVVASAGTTNQFFSLLLFWDLPLLNPAN
jgi:hypothetical protein